jgi:hypothetical protein
MLFVRINRILTASRNGLNPFLSTVTPHVQLVVRGALSQIDMSAARWRTPHKPGSAMARQHIMKLDEVMPLHLRP